MVEKLVARVMAELKRAGRDREKVRLALRWTMFSLEMSAGREEFSEEYRDWIMASWNVALLLALDQAVAEEEYEWASECQSLLSECQFIEEEV